MKFLSVILFVISFNALAQVKFAPMLIELDPKKRSSEITVINDGKIGGDYEVKLYPTPFETDDKLKQANIDDFKKYIRFSPKRFTVKPNSSQKVRVIMRRNNKLKGPFLLYVKLAPIFNPLNAEKDKVSILQDFVLPLVTYYKEENFKVSLDSVNVNKKNVTFNYSGLERAPLRGRYKIIFKDGKEEDGTIIFKNAKGSITKPLDKEVSAKNISKVVVTTFIKKEQVAEFKF